MRPGRKIIAVGMDYTRVNLDLVNAPDGTGPFPAGLDEHLVALRAAGYHDVSCFWTDARLALFGGSA